MESFVRFEFDSLCFFRMHDWPDLNKKTTILTNRPTLKNILNSVDRIKSVADLGTFLRQKTPKKKPTCGNFAIYSFIYPFSAILSHLSAVVECVFFFIQSVFVC